MRSPPPPLPRACVAEGLGTYLLVLFSIVAVAAATLTPSGLHLWQAASITGFGVALAIYVAAAASGAHLNPAVSLAFALLRSGDFPPRRLPAYWGAQLVGAVLAGATLYLFYGALIRRFEAANGITRGEPESALSAMVFGQYFPDPGTFGAGAAATFSVSPWAAAGVEAFGTAILALVIFALVDSRNTSLTAKSLAPFFIGFTVALLIALFAPLTQAGWNPARDFGPRLITLFAGWGAVAVPGPSNGFWVYTVGPMVGAPIGGLLYDVLIRPALPQRGSGADGDALAP